jgi:hypothetical protein
VGFEPTISTSERSQAYAFDGVAIWIGSIQVTLQKFGTLFEISIFDKTFSNNQSHHKLVSSKGQI